MHQGSFRGASGVFSEAWLSDAQAHGAPVVLLALEVLLTCQNRMLKRHSVLKVQLERREAQSVHGYLQNLYSHDDWVTKEYCGGFSAHTYADFDAVEDLLQMTDTSLKVSAQVSAMLLHKLKESGGTQFIYDETSFMSDEQQVVFAANQVLAFMKEAQT